MSQPAKISQDLLRMPDGYQPARVGVSPCVCRSKSCTSRSVSISCRSFDAVGWERLRERAALLRAGSRPIWRSNSNCLNLRRNIRLSVMIRIVPSNDASVTSRLSKHSVNLKSYSIDLRLIGLKVCSPDMLIIRLDRQASERMDAVGQFECHKMTLGIGCATGQGQALAIPYPLRCHEIRLANVSDHSMPNVSLGRPLIRPRSTIPA